MTRSEIEAIKQKYPVGTRVMCDYSADKWHPLTAGATGTVRIVDDMGTLHVDWDDGRMFGLCPEEDRFHTI